MYPNCIGLSDLIDEISQDHSLKPISSLCCNSNELKFVCFESAQPLDQMLGNYRLLSQVYPNDLFKLIWNSVNKSMCKAKLELTFTDVVERIWHPVFAQCRELTESIYSQTIKLRDVDRYFRGFEGEHIIFEHLRNLHLAITACDGKDGGTTRWIRSSVDLMQQYWALCEQGEAANIVLDLKDSLHLTGSFEVIESVASQVTESMKELSLSKIDCKLMDAKSFLEQVTADSKQLECLRQFAACSSIVEWIRKETTGKVV